LVLNAASSWAAFQVGALRHLVDDRRLHFDVHAGTGIGAMHAAFVACGELDALVEVWQRMGLRRLVRPSLRHPWRGPFTGAPQRRLIAAHVSESRLVARGTVVAAAVVDLRTGRVDHLVWPGCDLPIVDGLMAAVATPGLLAPVAHGGRDLAEATVVDAVPLRAVTDGALPGVGPVDEVVAVLATPLAGRRRYDTWRAVADRAVAVNLAHDADAAVDDATRDAAAAGAFDRVDRDLGPALAALVDDPQVRDRLVATVAGRRAAAAAAHPGRPRPPRLHVVRPTEPLDFPLWRFRDADVTDAFLHGHAAARAVMDAVP
jgi:predicted acylesterase/phospholipase RssA